MDNNKKCSMIEHKEIDAISFCFECKIYMCNKCEKLHSELFKNTHQYSNIKDKNLGEIFTGEKKFNTGYIAKTGNNSFCQVLCYNHFTADIVNLAQTLINL